MKTSRRIRFFHAGHPSPSGRRACENEKIMNIDLNSDLGEGCDADAEIMALITSANVCCGFHAGDATTARTALTLAKQHGVQVGAHPGYADREHFGRRELSLGEDAVFDLCVYQVSALAGLAKAVGIPLRYIKPHGALYNQACADDNVARPVVAAAKLLQLPVMALPGSRLEALCMGQCGFIREGFADRRYEADGKLMPRNRPGAFVHDVNEAVEQADRLLRERGITTLCVHGDNPQALEFVRGLREAFARNNINVRAFS
jgi:5-oxoprolinase (ATP-hydrolysing) subunit A